MNCHNGSLRLLNENRIDSNSIPEKYEFTIEISYNNCKSIRIKENYIHKQSISTLDVSNMQISFIHSLPSNIQTLNLYGNNITDWSSILLPKSLIELDLSHNVLKNLNELTDIPPYLRSFSCKDCQMTHITGVELPDSMKYLDLSGNSIENIEISNQSWSQLQNYEDLSLHTAALTACEDERATLHDIQISSKSLRKVEWPTAKACVLSDTEFLLKYTNSVMISRRLQDSSSKNKNESDSTEPKSDTNHWMYIAITFAILFIIMIAICGYLMFRRFKRNRDKDQYLYDEEGSLGPSTIKATESVIAGHIYSYTDGTGPSIDRSGSSLPMVPLSARSSSSIKSVAATVRTNLHTIDQANIAGAQDFPQAIEQQGMYSVPIPPQPYYIDPTQFNEIPPSTVDYSRKESNNLIISNDIRDDPVIQKFWLDQRQIFKGPQIAKGGYGAVFLATYLNKTVVIKQILPGKVKSKHVVKSFMDEIRICAGLSHPKIVEFIGVTWSSLSDLTVVMEYLPKGDLSVLLAHELRRQVNLKNQNLHGSFSWFKSTPRLPSKRRIAQDIVEALVYLHSFDAPIIHRDLKPKNVLMTENWTAKLTDFGISREMANDHTMTAEVGTVSWIAPEVLRGERYTESADIYSLGVILTELDTCHRPYAKNFSGDKNSEGISNTQIAVLVSSGSLRPNVKKDCPRSVKSLIRKCVTFDPEKRPSALQVSYELEHLEEKENKIREKERRRAERRGNNPHSAG